jgi:hypothetical protein
MVHFSSVNGYGSVGSRKSQVHMGRNSQVIEEENKACRYILYILW